VSRLEEAEQRLRQLEREIFQLKRFGRDRFEVGDVIRFTKTFTPGTTPKMYSYVAIKIEGGWCLSGSGDRRRMYDYDELIAYVVQHPAAENVQVATAWVDVTEAANDILTADMPAGQAPVIRGPYPYAKTGEPEYEIVSLKKFNAEEDDN